MSDLFPLTQNKYSIIVRNAPFNYTDYVIESIHCTEGDFDKSMEIFSIVDSMFFNDSNESIMEKIVKLCENEELLTHKVHGYVVSTFEFNYDIFIFAIIAGKIDVVKYLYNTGKFNIDQCYQCMMDNHTNALEASVDFQHPEITKYLLTLNPNLDLTDSHGEKLFVQQVK